MGDGLLTQARDYDAELILFFDNNDHHRSFYENLMKVRIEDINRFVVPDETYPFMRTLLEGQSIDARSHLEVNEGEPSSPSWIAPIIITESLFPRVTSTNWEPMTTQIVDANGVTHEHPEILRASIEIDTRGIRSRPINYFAKYRDYIGGAVGGAIGALIVLFLRRRRRAKSEAE